jgi:hypothetical protein
MTMTSASPRARRGRPATGVGLPVMVRMHEPLASRLDEWIAQQIERLSRPEAMRRLAALALAAAAEREL